MQNHKRYTLSVNIRTAAADHHGMVLKLNIEMKMIWIIHKNKP